MRKLYFLNESPRVFRRLFGLSQTASADSLNWRYFDCPPEIRRIIHATNATESVTMSLRKAGKTVDRFQRLTAIA
jgi:transposase-like protein